MRKGHFIVLEGVEGSGKSTQVRLLADWLQARSVPHIVTREPGGTELGEEIRQLLLHGRDMPPETELLLYNAARAVFVDEVVRPALAAGKVVVTDRFSLSTLAYQGYGRGLSLDDVRAICHFAVRETEPDLTIVLDVPLNVGEGRRATRSAPDRIEGAGTDFHEKVAEAYRLLPDHEANVTRVSGLGTEQEVHERIVSTLAEKFPETFAQRTG